MNASISRLHVFRDVILLTFLALAGCGQQKEVMVPAVVGKDATVARSELSQLGLKVTESPQVTARKTLGVVIDQDPKAGMKLAADGTVTLMIAAGEATLTVPNVVKLPFDEARTQLEAARLQVKRKEEQRATLEFGAGEVVSQNPAPFSPAAAGAVVELEIAGFSVVVPDVKGKGLQEATEILAAKKLLVSVGGEQRDPRQPVVATTPSANEVVLAGTQIVLQLEAPRPVTIYRAFPFPMQDGQRLDWCLTWATDCGGPAAGEWCKAQGYERVYSFDGARNVPTPTRVFKTGQSCGPGCDGFAQVTCSRSGLASDALRPGEYVLEAGRRGAIRRTFAPPMQDNFRLDWCLTWATDCGAPVATEWCKAQGYEGQLSFDRVGGVPTQTKVFRSGQLCGPGCDGFSQITCTREGSFDALRNGEYLGAP